MGDWFVWGGFRGPENRSAFGPNRSRRWADFADGLSNTMVASEGKAKQPLYRDCGGLSRVNDPYHVPGPDASPLDVVPEYRGAGCEFKTGHSEWTDGQAHHTGFTTAWTPNKRSVGSDPFRGDRSTSTSRASGRRWGTQVHAHQASRENLR